MSLIRGGGFKPKLLYSFLMSTENYITQKVRFKRVVMFIISHLLSFVCKYLDILFVLNQCKYSSIYLGFDILFCMLSCYLSQLLCPSQKSFSVKKLGKNLQSLPTTPFSFGSFTQNYIQKVSLENGVFYNMKLIIRNV